MKPNPADELILHAEAEFLVVNKPAGLPVIPEGWDVSAPCLVKILEAQHSRIWVVHRLDKITSGVMVFALTAEAHRNLSMQFERHEARKVYHAIVNGNPAWYERTTRQPLRADAGRSHRTVVDQGKGKPSETTFRVLERYESACLLEALPASGRTHQLRVHASALGHPLLGDRLYGAPPTDLIARPALHAWSLTLTHPTTGEMVSYSAAHPTDFRQALEKLRAG